MSQFIKSPFNYIGNKYRQLPQLRQIFPDWCDCFVDLMAGGLDVAINMRDRANVVFANDINRFVMDQIRDLALNNINDILAFIDHRIEEFQLSKTNEEGYLRYRDAYNHDPTYHTTLDLFTLTRFCFNNNLRFNESLEMNQAFGRNRSSFNPTQRKNTIAFQEALHTICLTCKDFRDFSLENFNEKDFIYLDPPYLISDASYNVRAKRANLRWEEKDDKDLMAYIDEINARGIRFAMSNVLQHKDRINQGLIDWLSKRPYYIHDIHSDYTACTYNHLSRTPSQEVVITNYIKGE